ncbi:MAG: DNA-methyltransferase [Gammaproteobacteria bacterium]
MTKWTDKIIIGDCLQIMADMPDNSVDICFADPPFNLRKKYLSHHDRMAEEDYLQWTHRWILQVVRVVKPEGSIFIHNIPKWLTHCAAVLNELAHFRHWIAWHANGRPLGKTLLPSHYGILYYTKSHKNFKFYDTRAPHTTCRKCHAYVKDYGGKENQRHPFGALVGDVWTDIHRIRHSCRRDLHPCQLPVHLLERLILLSTDAGDVVLDPFLGAGTTAMAAKKLGRHYIGIDIDEQYAQIARDNIAQAKESTLHGFYVSRFLGKVVTIRDADAKQIYGAPPAKSERASNNKRQAA